MRIDIDSFKGVRRRTEMCEQRFDVRILPIKVEAINVDVIHIDQRIGIVGVGVNINTTRPAHDAIVKNIANGKQNRITQGCRHLIMNLSKEYIEIWQLSYLVWKTRNYSRNGNLIERDSIEGIIFCDSDNQFFDQYIKE